MRRLDFITFLGGAVSAAAVMFIVAVPFIAPAAAQSGEPIKIGYGMALTGGFVVVDEQDRQERSHSSGKLCRSRFTQTIRPRKRSFELNSPSNQTCEI